jgi:hypothetical protein
MGRIAKSGCSGGGCGMVCGATATVAARSAQHGQDFEGLTGGLGRDEVTPSPTAAARQYGHAGSCFGTAAVVSGVWDGAAEKARAKVQQQRSGPAKVAAISVRNMAGRAMGTSFLLRNYTLAGSSKSRPGPEK